MPKIVVTHDVVDVDTWLQFKSERADAIVALGGSNVVDHVAQDGRNTVAIAAEVDDVAGMMTALSSPPPRWGPSWRGTGSSRRWRSTSSSSRSAGCPSPRSD